MKELSKKNPYWISRYRRKELEYWCLQYKEWSDYYISSLSLKSFWDAGNIAKTPYTSSIQDRAASYISNMDTIGRIAEQTDPALSIYIMEAVTQGKNYEIVNPPCCRNIWYAQLRKFYWLLDKARD